MNDTPTINNLEELKRILEAALLAADSPLSLREMKRMFEQELSEDMLRRALDELKSNWEGRGTELVQVAEGWRFQTSHAAPASNAACTRNAPFQNSCSRESPMRGSNRKGNARSASAHAAFDQADSR